jgi:hypothetical protein
MDDFVCLINGIRAVKRVTNQSRSDSGMDSRNAHYFNQIDPNQGGIWAPIHTATADALQVIADLDPDSLAAIDPPSDYGRD